MLNIYDLRISDPAHPLFSWKLSGDEGQKSYAVTVLDAAGKALWTSGECTDIRRYHIPCGIELPKGMGCSWSVTVTGTQGTTVSADGPCFFTPIPAWKARFVEPVRTRKPLTDKAEPILDVIAQTPPEEKLDPPVRMRKTFTLDHMPDTALMYASAHGIYHLWINGQRVSELFAPGFTPYKKRLAYQCYDAASCLQEGENVIEAVLADGWYTGKIGALGIGMQFGTENSLLFQLDLHDGDQISSVCSDKDCVWRTDAWTYADLFVGEGYDEGLAPSQWQPVRETEDGYETLFLQEIAPVEEEKEIIPTVLRTPNGDLLLDAGETTVGYAEFTLDLEAGDTVTLEYTETLDTDGNFMRNIIGQNKNQTDVYRAERTGSHTWAPSFTFHGFRYIRITGTENADPSHYRIIVVGTRLQNTGAFSCSDPRLNQLQENIVRSAKGNMLSIPTDCPQREKTGWTGDIQIFAPTACYELDVADFFDNWLKGLCCDQFPNGQIPHISPYHDSHDVMRPPFIKNDSSAAWSDACVIVPWRLYEAYGDPRILETHYPMMKRYMDSTEELAHELPPGADTMSDEQKARQIYLWNTGFQYGEWLMPSFVAAGKSSIETAMYTAPEMATAMYAITTQMMSEICTVLDKPAEAEYYVNLNRKIRNAFFEEFCTEEGLLKKEFQGLYVLALKAQVLPEALQPAAAARLARLIRDNGTRLDTGFPSVAYLLPILKEYGYGTLANELLFQNKAPSWLYEVEMGATTMWESWLAVREDGTCDDCSMNHFAFGCVGEYLFSDIAGIRPAEPGFRSVIIEPDLDCGLSEVDASYESIWGTIRVHWALKEETGLSIDVTLPPDVSGILRFDGREEAISAAG